MDRMSPELWNRIPPEAQAIFVSMAETIARLERRVAELEARLNKTPRNSSQPPGSEHPHAKPPTDRKPSRRKRGGQPGHEKHERTLVPTEQCDVVKPLRPANCRRCGEALSGNDTDTDPLRHQVWELPEIKPHVTEYQQYRLTCPCCGTSTTAELPAGIPQGHSGPRLTAFTGLLMGCFRQSKRRTALFLEAFLGQPCSTGLVVKLQNMTTQALRPGYDELCGLLPAQSALNIDETPMKEATIKSWLWTFVARDFTLFAIRPTRGAAVLDELLTDRFCGVVTCDRAKMYWQYESLQWCWAHLKRDFQKFVDSGHRRAGAVGTQLLEQVGRLFRQWRRFLDGLITRTGLKQTLSHARSAVEQLLREGFVCGHAPTEGTCTELLHHRRWLWTFLDRPEIPPTNNAAERALRHGVIWRKLSFGTQSAAGSRFVETLLTVIETCRQQKRNVFAFVTDAVARLFRHKPPVSLFNTA